MFLSKRPCLRGSVRNVGEWGTGEVEVQGIAKEDPLRGYSFTQMHRIWKILDFLKTMRAHLLGEVGMECGGVKHAITTEFMLSILK